MPKLSAITILSISLGGYFWWHLPEHFLSKASFCMEEICDNAQDDDSDGLIDLNDPDCSCEVIAPRSLIPNPSFEEQDCCPNWRSQLNCATGWIQASEPTTDYLHECGWMGWEEYPPPFPFPDGNGAMGFRDGRVRRDQTPEYNWKEYAGACLSSPLQAGTTYRFEFYVGFVDSRRSPNINITFFGTPDCEQLPFGVGNEAFGCPTNGPYWANLGATFVRSRSDSWVPAAIEITPPIDIEAIAIGPDCPPVNSTISTYYYFDNLVLADNQAFSYLIDEVNHPCATDFSLRVRQAEGDYQWYLDGVALLGETEQSLSQLYGPGNYQVRLNTTDGCRLTQAYSFAIPVLRANAYQRICDQSSYTFGDRELFEAGIYIDTLSSVDGCDSITTLELEVIPPVRDTIRAHIFAGETFTLGDYNFQAEGTHLASFTSNLGCDSLVHLELAHYDIYIPNAFSPNSDGINDYFQVYGQPTLLQSSDLQVFDRWGGLVFQGERWDGQRAGQLLHSGTYTWVARLLMSDGIERLRSGSVLLLP